MEDEYEHIVRPKAVIEGAPSIKRFRILNDKRHILTQDSENNVSMYDVLQVSSYSCHLSIQNDNRLTKNNNFTIFYVIADQKDRGLRSGQFRRTCQREI